METLVPVINAVGTNGNRYTFKNNVTCYGLFFLAFFALLFFNNTPTVLSFSVLAFLHVLRLQTIIEQHLQLSDLVDCKRSILSLSHQAYAGDH